MRKLLLSVAVLTAGTSVFAAGLKPQDGDSIRSYQMNEVVVNASRSGNLLKSIPQKVEIISGSTLKALPNDNLAEVLKRATNLDIIQYPGLSAQVAMRGFSPSAHNRSVVLVLINGESAGTTNLATIAVDNVERIEVIKGPYAVLYGSDAMGGVINIITKKAGKKSQGSASVEAGSFGYNKLGANFTGVANDKFSYGLSYSRQQQTKDYRIGQHNLLNMTEADKLILDKASYGDAMDNTQYELNVANAFADYKMNPQWKVRAEGSYTYAYDVETAGNYWSSYGQSKKDVNRFNLYASLEQQNAVNHFRFAPYYTNDKNPNYSDNTDAGFINFTSSTKEYGYQLQDGYKFGNLNFTVGQDIKVYDYTSNNYSAKGVETAPYKPDNRFTNIALFGQAVYNWNDLNVNAGLRYDRFNYHIDANAALNAPDANAHYNTVNPSVGAQYAFWNFKAHASYGTAFYVPDAYQMSGKYTMKYTYGGVTYSTDYIGNPNLKPEKSRTTDFGLSYTSADAGLKLDVTYFHTLYDNKIVNQYVAAGTTFTNANQSTMNGLELVSAFNFGKFISPKLLLEAYANFTWMLKNDFTQTVSGVVKTYDMQFARNTNGNFGLNYQYGKVNMRLNGRLIGTRLEKDNFSYLRPGIKSTDYYTQGGYAASDKMLQLPAYMVFDYSIGYAYSQKVNFGITASNLLDENYTEKDGYNMPGRSIVAKLSYAF
ncbi:TonB-dependent receptor plug domain-containing protein [Paludibacter jiangxiensis]|uniref:Hemoglobin/transferrin/lactoferrin receptor protein n=1 Tax=Paludibacter jiangxiensis TaxID=681398 RepID=A0A161M601_9BACT|nr:TonB-dependent receptor [Paludibacter jiangxiensis]GAT63973.1 hemoglobin/transferrin/lactoferrin receptor protein [Paludibacter jiangxiensis]